jgi:hypothetical protein
MKQLVLITLLLISAPAKAGSYSGTWPNMNTFRVLDALACATMALHAPNGTWKCAAGNAWTVGNNSAECMFVFPFNGVKTVWHLEGSYNDAGDWSGNIWQTTPSCTGFLCSYIGTVNWYGRSPMPPATYSYVWSDGNTAGCDVTRSNGVTIGLFYGSY